MEILFRGNRELKLCTREREAVKRLGKANAGKLSRRMAALVLCADLLELTREFPTARCHMLRGDRRGCFAVDLHGSWRLVFTPAHDPVPTRADGGVDLEAVTRIEIVEVVDYHG